MAACIELDLPTTTSRSKERHEEWDDQDDLPACDNEEFSVPARANSFPGSVEYDEDVCGIAITKERVQQFI